jgi:hypothetical protein
MAVLLNRGGLNNINSSSRPLAATLDARAGLGLKTGAAAPRWPQQPLRVTRAGRGRCGPFRARDPARCDQLFLRSPGNSHLTSGGENAPPSFAQLHEPLTLGRLRTPPRRVPHTTRRRQHNPQHLGSVATVDGNTLPPGVNFRLPFDNNDARCVISSP